jgi:hypothetical protein
LDYLGRPNVIIRVLICGRKRQKKKSERGHMRKILPNVAGLEDVVRDQGKRAASRSCKREGNGLSPQTSKKEHGPAENWMLA